MSGPVDPRLLRRAPAGRRLIVMLTGLQVFAAVLTVAQATLLVHVVVAIFTRHAGVADVARDLTLLGGIGVTRAALAGAQEWLTARASLVVRGQLRRATLDAIVRLGPDWARRQPPGRLVNATGPGLDGLDGYLTRALPALVAAGVVPAVVLARIGWADWQSGLILLILLPLVPLFMALVGMATKRHVEKQYVILGRLAGQFLDLLRGLTTLRIYGRAEAQEATLRTATDAYRRQTVATLRVAFLSGLVLDLLAALSVAVVAVDIGLRLDDGHVSFATALLVLVLAPELFAPLRAMGAQHHATQEGTTAAKAALDIIDEGSVAPVGSARPVARATGRVRFDGVTVSYPGRDEPALRGVTLNLEPSQVAALTGPSGAGKSTLFATLLGFAPPSAGSVSLEETDGPRSIQDLDLDRHRQRIAWLPQRPRPSQETVAQEVRLGDLTASDLDVADACHTCRTPPPGTALGEDGRAVSAGQRRRIALARVLLRAQAVRAAGGVPLVLLDEPSEDLDHDNETVVADIIAGLRGWATVVLATHSEALAELADVRVFIADGRVVAQVAQPLAARPLLGGVRPARSDAFAAGEARRDAPAVARAQPYRLRDLVRESGATRRLMLAAALSALGALCGLGLTASAMWLISRAAQHPNVQALAIAVVGVRTFAIGRALLRYGERLATHDGALHMLAALRVRVFAALRPLSPDALGHYGRGDLLRRFVGDVDGVQEGLARAVVPISGAIAGGLGAVALAALLAPIAAAALFAGLLVAGGLVPTLAYRLAGSADDLVRIAGQRDARSAALLDALDELVAYGQAATAVDAITAADDALVRVARRSRWAAAAGGFGATVAAGLTLVAVLAAAAASVSSGRLPVVDIGVLAVCALSGFEAVATLPAAFVAWARCQAGLRRVAEVTSHTPAFTEPAHPVGLPRARLGARARALTLAPAATAAAVLTRVDFGLDPGERIVIVGPSGCGKSTLLAAALRLVPVRAGRFMITGDGAVADLSTVRAADVPPAIAGSLQGDHVFDATLRDNLRVVRPAATDAELDDVARRAGLRRFVESLPAGWSTPAGPDGAVLSGGQRQRLLLARALLADPEILVLDEPTAHLDADTERLVLDDLLGATSDRTVLMTTHRQVVADQLDRVLRISRGALVADPVTAADVVPA